MRSRRHHMPSRMFIALALLPAAVGNAPADVLEHISSDAIGFVVVNRLEATSGKAEQVMRIVQVPAPNPLRLLKISAGIEAGFDDKGDMAVMMMPALDEEDAARKLEEAYPIALLPVTDFSAFVAQFEPEDADAKIVDVDMAGEPVLLGKVGSYAAVAEPKNRKEFLKFISGKANPPAEIAPLREWIASSDIVGVATTKGIELALTAADEGIENAKKLFENIETPEGGMSPAAALGMYQSLFDVLKRDVTTAGVGVFVNESVDVHVTSRFIFRPESGLAEAVSKLPEVKEDLLAGLPGGPFVMSFAATWSEELSQQMADWTTSFMQQNAGLYGFSDLSKEEVEKLSKVTEQALAGLRSMSIIMLPGEGRQGIYDGFYGVIKVNNAGEYLLAYRESLKIWNQVAEKSESPAAMHWEMEEAKVAGNNALKIEVDMSAMLEQQAGPQADQMIEMMFGQASKMTAYLIEVDEHTIFMSYADEEEVEKALKSLKDGEAGHSKNAMVQETAKRLDDDVQMIGYFSPQGTIELSNRVIGIVGGGLPFRLPAFPETPPVGGTLKMDDQGMATDLVLPVELLKEMPGYVKDVQAQFAQ